VEPQPAGPAPDMLTGWLVARDRAAADRLRGGA
jgi:hypothetical protein